MKRSIILVTFTLLAILLLGPSSQVGSFAQQIPGTGFSIVSDTVDETTDIGEAVVKVTHGTTSSTHTITYEDSNEDGGLDCGDTIISIS